MPLNDNGRNDAVNGLAGATTTGVTFLSLHSAFPGTTGANELTGGSPAYARKAATWGSAASGVRTQSGSATFDVPAANTVRFIGGWDAATVGNFKSCWAVNGVDKEIQVDTVGDFVLSEGHGYSNGDNVVFMGLGGTVPGGLTEGTLYFVVGSVTDKFQVSATNGGSAIDLTSKGDARVVVSKIIPEVFAAQGQAVVSNLQLQVGA